MHLATEWLLADAAYINDCCCLGLQLSSPQHSSRAFSPSASQHKSPVRENTSYNTYSLFVEWLTLRAWSIVHVTQLYTVIQQVSHVVFVEIT